MFNPHDNLADEVNRAVVASDVSGGIKVDDIRVGSKLLIYMKSCYYVLERRGDGFWISERMFRDGQQSKFCPEPVKCTIAGSLFHPEGSMLRRHWIGRGMFLEFGTADYPRLISPEILEIKEDDQSKS